MIQTSVYTSLRMFAHADFLILQDEHAKRIAVSRAAAHIHAILRGQATPISPVPPYPGNRPLAPPPDMVCRPDGQLPVRPGMHMHMGVQMPPPGYMGGHPGVPQHPMHATATQAPPGAPMGMLGPNPHLQGMPGAQPRPGHAQAVPAQFMPSSLPPHVAPPPHQQLYAQAPVDPVAHMQAASPHLSTQTQPPFYGQPAQQAQLPRPSSSILADTAPGRLVAPGGVADPTSGHSHTSSAGPKGAPPRPHGPSSGPLPSQEQAGSSCTVPIDFSGQPGFDVVQRLRGPGNSYISHIERETGATIELRGLGSGSHARADQPLHVFIQHHDPWRRKPAEDLIHSLLQTVRSAASASAVAHPSAPQPHAPQTMYPLGPATDSNAPSSAQAPQGAWAGGSSGPGESTAWPAYRHQPQPVHHQAAAFSGQFAMQQGMVAASAPVHPGTAEPDPHHQFQRSEPVKSGIESVAAAPPGIQANSALPSSNAVGSHAGPASGEGAAAGRTATRNENGQDARQPPKRKFREFKEESRSTQNRVCRVLLSWCRMRQPCSRVAFLTTSRCKWFCACVWCSCVSGTSVALKMF